RGGHEPDGVRRLAARLHRGDVDDRGEPFLAHLNRVAELVRACGGDRTRADGRAPTRCPEHRCVLLPPAPDGGTAAGVPAAGRGYASTVRAARSAVGAAAAPPVDGAAVRRETRRRLPVAAARVGGSVA